MKKQDGRNQNDEKHPKKQRSSFWAATYKKVSYFDCVFFKVSLKPHFFLYCSTIIIYFIKTNIYLNKEGFGVIFRESYFFI